MNKYLITLGIFVITVSAATADDLTLSTGQVLRNYKISRVEPDGVIVIHSSGISKIPTSEMPASYRTDNGQQDQSPEVSSGDKSAPRAQSDLTYARQWTKTGTILASARLANGASLFVEYGNEVVYGAAGIGSGSIQREGLYISDTYHVLLLRGDKVVGNKLVQLKGYQYRVAYQSLTPDVADISEDGHIEWKSPGQAQFRISASDMRGTTSLGSIVIPVKVIRLPINIGEPSDKVVEALGFPDRKTEKYYEWTERIGYPEGICYFFEVDGYGETVQHYSYARHPALKIRINTASLTMSDVKTIGWDSGYSIGME